MYVSTFKSGKDGKNTYVRLMESYRDDNGTVRKRVVKKLGRLEDMLAKDPMALEKLKEQYSDERAAKKRATVETKLETLSKIISLPNEAGSSNMPYPLLRYGLYPLRKIWNDVLNFPKKIKYLQKSRTSRRYDLNDALLYLTAHKAMNPTSILGAFEDKDNYIGDPAGGLSLDQMYDAYSFADEVKEDIFEWVNRRMDEAFGHDRATLIFYDVTNVYFESPLTDEERELERSDFADNVLEMAREARAQGTLDGSCFSDGQLVPENLPAWFWEAVSDEKIQYLKMRGPSKEHRFDLPLVSIALVIDKNGFPMDFAVYSGNASEFKTMGKSITALREKYDIGGAVVVADRGLNSLSNLEMLTESGLGFLMAQKVTQFNAGLTALMLDRSRYKPINKEDPDIGGYQIIENWEKTGSGQNKSMECTLVLTYNEARRKRDEAILENWVNIVKKKKAAGVKLGPRRTGWASLAKTEDGTDQPIIGVDEDVLEGKRRLCGFAAMVYKKARGTEGTPLSGADIASVYHRLNGIEECFRIMKSNLGLRPMYVWTDRSVRGHVTICVLALLLVRLLQQKLKMQGHSLSIDQLCSTLRNASVLAMQGNEGEEAFILAGGSPEVRHGRHAMKTKDLVKMIQKGQLTVSHEAEVMKACGLRPLPRICNRHELARCLGTRFSGIEEVVPEVNRCRM